MKHRILLGLSVFLLPSVGGALGLGKLELLSALHEPFHARVELLSASPAELDSLRLSLADSEAFARAGIPRKLILTRLRFSVRETETGSDYIEIRSVVPIREPFLNFLLEVSWSKGRLYKEYTALLDPPKNVLPPPQKRQAPADLERDKRGTIRRPAPATPTTTRAIDYTGGDYGPAVTGDTLWSIAKAARPDTSVSIQQMMLAIVRLNPTAFIENNINGLRRGAILKMPDITEIAALGKPDAFASAHEQNMLWDEYRGRVAGQPVPTVVPVPSPPTPIQAEPTPPPPVEAPSPEPTPTPPPAEAAEAPSPEPAPAPAPTPPTQPAEQSELKLITETDGESAVQDAPSLDLEAGELSNELALKSEAIEALLMEGAQLQDRLGENEIIINDLQRLIALKEDSLALIQEQARMADVEVIDETVVAEAVSEQAAPVAPEPEETAPEDSVTVSDSDVTAQAGQATESFIGLADLVEKAKGWVEKAKAHLPIIGAILGGILFLVIALLAFSRWRQRKSDEELLVIDDLEQADVVTDDVDDVGEVSNSEVTEISEDIGDISDSDISDSEITQTGEGAGDLDVFDIGDEDKTAISVGQDLSEVQVGEEEQDSMENVNVLLAYEQFGEAADVINQALQDDPNNLEYLSKLLEVYYAEGNKKAYEEIAKRIHEQTNGEGNYWDIAVAMWSELSPKRELFSTPTDDEEESVVSGDTGVLNIAGEGGADEDMDFDIGGDSLDDGSETMPGMEASPSLDFLGDEEKGVLDVSSDSVESKAPSLEDSNQSLSITATGEDQISDLTATSMTEGDVDITDESDDTLGGVDLDFTEIDYDTNAPDEDGVALETEDEDADSLSFAADDEAAESVTEEVPPPPAAEDEDADSLSFAADDEAAESVTEEVPPPPATEDDQSEDTDSLSFAVDDEVAESVTEEVPPPPATEDDQSEDTDSLSFAVDDEVAESVTEEVPPPPAAEDNQSEDTDSLSFAVDDEVAESVTEEVPPPPAAEDEDADSLSFAADDEAAESVTEEVPPPPATEDDQSEDTDSLSFAVDDEVAESVTEEVPPPPAAEDEDADSLSFAADDEASESVTEEVPPPLAAEDEDTDSLSFAVDDEVAESVTEEVPPPPAAEDDQSLEQPIEETIIDTRLLEPLAMQAAADKKAGGLLDESSPADFDADEDLLDITTTTAHVNKDEDLDSLHNVAEDDSDLEKTPALSVDDPLSSDITDPEITHNKTVKLPQGKNPLEDGDDDVKYDQTLLIPKSPALQEQSEDEEMASQLDLAKAYIELGERDSAKLILDDILKHGDAAYRQQAEELNEQLK